MHRLLSTTYKIFYTPWLPFSFVVMALKWVVLNKRGKEYVIPHEEIHIQQQREIGYLKYMFKYLTNKDFRIAMEFEAYFKGSKLSIRDAKAKALTYANLLTL